MSNSLEQSLLDILNSTVQTVKDGVSFLSAQIPDVVQQLLMWKFTEAVVLASICLLIIVVLFSIAYMFHRNYKKQITTSKYHVDAFNYYAPVVVLLFVSVLPFGFLFGNVLQALKIYIAPKLYLIEYAAALVK